MENHGDAGAFQLSQDSGRSMMNVWVGVYHVIVTS